MLIKQYVSLNLNDQKLAYDFLTRNEENKRKFEEVDSQLKDEAYGFGNGTIFAFNENRIIGKAFVVLKEARRTGTAYVTAFEIEGNTEDASLIVDKLLNEAAKIAETYGANTIYIGTKNERIIGILSNFNIHKQYSAIKMILKNRDVKLPLLDLMPLSENNKFIYMNLHNEGFGGIPNGGTLSENQLNAQIRAADDKTFYFIAMSDNEPIGILQCEIDNGVGIFDIALKSSSRGKGYGKRLLETAIDFLNSRNVEEISLIVITKNTLAYELYKKRGFIETEIVSHWFRYHSH